MSARVETPSVAPVRTGYHRGLNSRLITTLAPTMRLNVQLSVRRSALLVGVACWAAPHGVRAQDAADCDESSGWVWPVILVIVLVVVAGAVAMKRRHSKELSALRRQQLETKATEVIETATRSLEDEMESAHLSTAQLARTASSELQTREAALLAKDEEIARLKERLASFEGEPTGA